MKTLAISNQSSLNAMVCECNILLTKERVCRYLGPILDVAQILSIS
jgi:hypothetical protein